MAAGDPSLTAKLLEAVELALAGDWPAGHLIVQEHEGNALADWIHAVAHRMEGDLGNARYWYRRCGRALREEVSFEAELREIRDVLELRRQGLSPGAARTDIIGRR